jgi:hypothetical protein
MEDRKPMLISYPTEGCTNSFHIILTDNLTMKIPLRLFEYHLGKREIPLPSHLSGYSDSDTLVINEDGYIRFKNSNDGRIGTNGKRLTCKLRGKKYDGFNGYDDTDLEFLQKKFGHAQIYQEFLRIIFDWLARLNEFIQSEYPNHFLHAPLPWIHQIEFCSDVRRPLDLKAHFERFSRFVSRYYRCPKRIHRNDVDIEAPEYYYEWPVPLNRGRKDRRKRKEKRYLKHYLKRGYLRTEFRFESPKFRQTDMAGLLDQLVALGDLSSQSLADLLKESDFVPTIIDPMKFNEQLKKLGVKDPESKKWSELLRQASLFECYSPSRTHSNLRLDKIQTKKISHPEHGLFKKSNIMAFGKRTRFPNYILREDWESVDPAKIPKEKREPKSLDEGVLLERDIRAIEIAIRETVRFVGHQFQNAISSIENRLGLDESDEIIKLLRAAESA